MKDSLSVWGLFSRLLSLVIPIKKRHWVFGSDYGNNYKEGSKYIFEYMIQNHPEYQCSFITRNKTVYNDLRSKGYPCYMNLSISGIIKVLEADTVFFTQSVRDVLFSYKHPKRKLFYTNHGQPYKVSYLALYNKDFYYKVKGKKQPEDIPLLKRLLGKVTNYLVLGHSFDDFNITPCCSDFLSAYHKLEFQEHTEKPIIGMARNDALFDDDRMKREKWLPDLNGKIIITYMPTHRMYGKGELSPILFINRDDVQSWLTENNIVLLVKNHPNMASKIKEQYKSTCIIDITKETLDPQVILYHTDILITDYSSVWMDYLLLKRPILYYIYDDWNTNDAGTYYDLREDPPGTFCYSEDELYSAIKKCVYDNKKMQPSDRIISKFHKYRDGNNCKRTFEYLSKRYI